MMPLEQLLTLGVIQGVTEYLPISSSGHLALVGLLAPWGDQGLLFDISLHLGTLLAVFWYFRQECQGLVKGTRDLLQTHFYTREAQLVWHLGLMTLPAAILGYLLADFVALTARHLLVLGATSILFGVLLGWADRCKVRLGIDGVGLNWQRSLMLGVFQALALIPGTSRSGSVYTGARLLGYSRVFAGKVTALSAIPITVLVVMYAAVKQFGGDAPEALGHWRDFVIGISLTFVTAVLGIHILMTFVAKVGAWPFAVYRVILGIFLLLLGFGVITW